MKLVSISTIKNEADIIESFIRYHTKIFDLMIILDNGSTDDTIKILEELMKEELPFVLLHDTDRYFEIHDKYRCLLKKSINEYDADIICPLDADEFISSNDGNPRKIIEKIPPKSFYTAKWKTFVPTDEDDINERFVPKRIQHVRDESFERLGKIVITKELVNDYDVTFELGNHTLKIDEKHKSEIKNIRDSGLRIAHYPLRSINHTMAKVLTNYPNSLARKVIKKGSSHHYTIMFNKIKETGSLDMEDVTTYAKNYSLLRNAGREDFADVEIEIHKDPLDISFCEDIEVKYSFTENPLAILLENNVYFAHEIHKFKNILDNELQSDEKEDEYPKNNENNSSIKSKVFGMFLNRSNSYNYYQSEYERLSKENKKLKKQLKRYL